MQHLALVGLYLSAIVAANLSVAAFGPASTIINAFLFIGLDITARDRLHDAWSGQWLWLKMGLLILAGSALSWLINRDAGRIAVASMGAFAAAGLVDALVYQSLHARRWLVRVNGSNLASAAVDSVVFPWLAFGSPIWWVVLGQFVAKVAGGAVWAVLLQRLLRPAGRAAGREAD